MFHSFLQFEDQEYWVIAVIADSLLGIAILLAVTALLLGVAAVYARVTKKTVKDRDPASIALISVMFFVLATMMAVFNGVGIGQAWHKALVEADPDFEEVTKVRALSGGINITLDSGQVITCNNRTSIDLDNLSDTNCARDDFGGHKLPLTMLTNKGLGDHVAAKYNLDNAQAPVNPAEVGHWVLNDGKNVAQRFCVYVVDSDRLLCGNDDLVEFAGLAPEDRLHPLVSPAAEPQAPSQATRAPRPSRRSVPADRP